MNNTNTGGPAFPIDRQTAHGIAIHEVGAGNEAAYIEAVARLSHGMTLRDYFAAKAMQGLMGRVWGDLPADELFTVWSKSAYAMADAMLKAREA